MPDTVESIKNRNKRVEADKAWEISKTRRCIIAILTYFIVVIFLFAINAPRPWLTALVPTTGFILSTLSLPFIKNWWIKKIYKK